MIAIRCHELTCHRPEWTYGPSHVENLSLALEEGLLHGFHGEPRSGKTLLLHLLGLLEPHDSGSITLFDQDIDPAHPTDTANFRNAVFGYLFPSPCLLPSFSVTENLAMPLFRMTAPSANDVRERITEVLDEFAISHLVTEPAEALSLTEQHTVALARALIHRPRILIAIQPPPALHDQLRACVRSHGLTALWCGTADNQPTGCDRSIVLSGGRILPEPSFLS